MSVYKTIVSILEDVADEPEVAAREILTALRALPTEAVGTGISAEQWIGAADAMLRAADDVDLNSRLAEATQRKAAWPPVQAQLESLGCRLWMLSERDSRWRIEGPGVDAEIDLHTGELNGLDGAVVMREPHVSADGFFQVEWTMEQLVSAVSSRIAARHKRDADKARRASAKAISVK